MPPPIQKKNPKPKSRTKGRLILGKITRSPGETLRFARDFSRKLRAGDVLALTGDLGSGKTTFVKGIALGLGLRSADEVKSPTFVLMHVYPTRIPIYHFDLYRLESVKDFEAIGLDEYVNDPRAITCMEWAEKAKAYWPRSTYRIAFKVKSQTARNIEIRKE